MELHLNLAEVISIAFATIGAIWALMKMIARQQERALDHKFEGFGAQLATISSQVKNDREATARVERELFALRAELPRDYVRRDDFVRTIGTIETKIDNMALRVERALTERSKP